MGKTRIDEAFASGDLDALAFRFSPIGIVVTENRTIRACNPAFAAMFGYEVAELRDQSFRKLYPTDRHFATIRDRGVESLRQSNLYWDERIMRRKDGSLFWCRVRGQTLTRENPLQRAVWSFGDLSGHRPYRPLTKREAEIAGALGEGKTSKEIARGLGISPRTVEVYRARLHKKFGVPNTSALLLAMSGAPHDNVVPEDPNG